LASACRTSARGADCHRRSEIEGHLVGDIEELPERQLGQRRRAPFRQAHPQTQSQIGGGARGRNREVSHSPGQPQRLEVGDGAARRDMAPVPGRVVSDHARELFRDLQLEPGGHRRDLERDVVGVVQHGREVADLRCERLLPDHVTLVAAAEERDVAFELGQQTHQPLGQGADRLLVALLPLVDLPDGDTILGVVIAPPEHMVPQRLDDEALEQLRIFGLGAEKPGLEGIAGMGRHAVESGCRR